MGCFRVLCESCDTEYYLTSVNEEFENLPKSCSFCGSELDEDNITDETENSEDAEWDKLSEESLDDLDDDWK